MVPFMRNSRKCKSRMTESRSVVAWGWGSRKGQREELLRGTRKLLGVRRCSLSWLRCWIQGHIHTSKMIKSYTTNMSFSICQYLCQVYYGYTQYNSMKRELWVCHGWEPRVRPMPKWGKKVLSWSSGQSAVQSTQWPLEGSSGPYTGSVGCWAPAFLILTLGG